MSAADDTYDILRSIRALLRGVSEHSSQIARESGLTVPQLLCLRALGDREPATVVHIGQQVQMSPSNVSGVLDRLESAGLVLRTRSTEDRRKVFVALTEAGRERLRDLPSPLHDRFVERLGTLPESERSEIASVLARVAAMMAEPGARDPA